MGNSSNNIIDDCFLRNENLNINIIRETGGITQNNLIHDNIISSGYAGISMVNNGLSTSGGNIISQNVIMQNGQEIGFGIYMKFDSTQVTNNIFWDNNIALNLVGESKSSIISNNSFYQNKRTLVVGQNSSDNAFINNTLSENHTEYIKIRETENTVVFNNSIINYSELRNIVINFTDSDLDISENYWGTSSEEIIQELIYDNDDSPLYGSLTFMPFSEFIDTVNPMAPVYNVKKQKVGNNLKVCWNSNQEKDLKSYRLYFGDFKEYSFSSYLDDIVDTVIYLPQNFDIEDDIAITAIDSLASNMYLLDGHESPFAFAVAYPYAGEDTTVCNDINAYDVIGSTAPFSFDYLKWETNGDGAFNNENLVAPQYFFGNNDILNGGVTLIMTAVVNEINYQDSLKINILKYPEAYAGNDTIILLEDEYYAINSFAQDYDSIRWRSLGDGTFDTATVMNPVYTPGLLDNENGTATLIINAYSRCGLVSDSINLIIEPYYSLQGRLLDVDFQPYPGNIIAMRLNEDNKAIANQMQETQIDGKFKFDKIRGGKYYIYGVPDTNNLENYVPVYYPDKLNWNNSYLIDVQYNTYDLDVLIRSVDYILPEGDGIISGSVSSTNSKYYNEDIYCQPWFENGINSLCTEGSSNITIFLYNSDRSKLLDYTLSDWQGNFYFNNLPYGSYTLIAEKASYNSFASDLISLNQENKIEDNLILEFTENDVLFKSISDPTENNNLIELYPNPVSDILYISSEHIIQEISIYNDMGVKIYELKDINRNLLNLETNSFKKGFYMIYVTTSKSMVMKKVIFT
ncbi:MAG: hypothetical protein C0598_03430 [Marinilabiliales bacterium]|nr:MAG: hypothetical protein C0598_03430 [Marinilabiliales bacterium]